MTSITLSQRDINVLKKIKDPESNPAAGVVIDQSLPRDPQITEESLYESVVQQERDIIRSIQALETQLGGFRTDEGEEQAVAGYQACVSRLDALIASHPNYASARNNRAQVARRLYGDAMLLDITTGMPMPLIMQPEQQEKRRAAAQALDDMEAAISLLSPTSFGDPISPQAARTLSMAHTQRAAIYLKTSKLLGNRQLDVDGGRREAGWSRLDFEEAASHDLALGGRYGNQIAKGLAVSVNPTAKLCGQIVREAMRKEYGPGLDS
ncbi:Tetratricopeptide repeat protein 36 -like protein [Escovopsis weberi]|uniref:Tetratricopeptide repeat protein 36-like protein n=1 Tax=Escovopsis weberi TaxID=150374 RepID=A0A0M8MZU7_ESCWE|nr:Tetratricopeptide repeat protein 36 -like protein [Escovopsis weberi]